jgi:hypothetical protein
MRRGSSGRTAARIAAQVGNRRPRYCGCGDAQPGPDQASSLGLAMGLTTILTTIRVCPPKYAEVQNPYI